MDEPETARPAAADDAARATPARDHLERLFRIAALVVLGLVGLVATFRTYFALEQAIYTWLRPQWVPLAQAAWGAFVLALVVWLLRVWVIGRAR